MPNIQVRLRRGSATDHDTTSGGFTGAEGEVTVDTTNDTLRVHDGSTVGGVRLAKHSELGGLADGSVTTAKLADGAVTPAKTDFDGLQIEADSTSEGQNGIASLEIVGISGALIDLRQDPEGDYDARLINQTQQTSLISKDPVLIQTGTTPNTALNIHTDGKVKVGSSSTPAYALDVAGDVNVTGDFKVNGTNFAPTVADDSVTFAKMQNINTAKVIGRTSAGAGNPEEVSILDEDAMTSDSATALATQQSIKAYVDSQAGALSVSSWAEGAISSGTEVQAPDNDKNFAGVYVRSNQCNWNETASVNYYTNASTTAETFFVQGAGDGSGNVRTSSLLLVPLYTNSSGNKVMKLSWSNMAVISGRYWI